MKIISVVGARPNFMKVAALHKAILNYNAGKSAGVPDSSDSPRKDQGTISAGRQFRNLICHTGQHYDEKMSKIFFEDLELPEPEFYLGVGSGSHAEQTAGIMLEFEKVLLNEKPELVIVVGDVNSTIACSLVAAKLNIKVAHIEAGLRSFDMSMPEEINRILTDRISDYLFVSEKSGLVNLKNEGIPDGRVFFTGNVMIDSLVNYLPKASGSGILKDLGLIPFNFVLVTLHRPSNVDDLQTLKEIIDMLNRLAGKRKIIFPVHPRTRINLDKLDISLNPGLIMTDPIGYIDFLALTKNAELVITDSGGIQEETTYLGIQCITLRDNTERPVTVNEGTNHMTGTKINNVETAADGIINGRKKKGKIPEMWDGKAGDRIVGILAELMFDEEAANCRSYD